MNHFDTTYIKRKNYISIGAMGNDHQSGQQQIINSIDFELRIPIAVMRSNIQLLKKFCKADSHSHIEESFLFCEEAIDDMLRFASCINFLNEANHNAIKVKNKRFKLNAFISQVIKELGQSNYDVSRIGVNMESSDLTIMTDKYLLNKILINLLVNALKFSVSSVELFVSVIKNKLTITVRDYGIGIPKDEIATIISPFMRASNVKMIKGTGLGLSIVSKSVEYLNGSIYVDSDLNKGSEFMFIIPVEIENEGKAYKLNSKVVQL